MQHHSYRIFQLPILSLLIIIVMSCTPSSSYQEAREGYMCERITIDDNSAYLLVPQHHRGQKLPAIVVLHDHGAHFSIGKEKMVHPLADEPDWVKEDAEAWVNKYYGGQYVGDSLAQQGYVVLATDAYGWGERAVDTLRQSYCIDSLKSINKRLQNRQPEIATLLRNQTGMTWMEQMITDDRKAVDYLCNLPYVDTDRIYCFGFSMGAVRSWGLAATDRRIAGCAFSNWMTRHASLETYNPKQLTGPSSHSMSIAGAFPEKDYPEVAAMIAPRPMFMMAGTTDNLFDPASVDEAAGIIREAYGADSTHYTMRWYEVAHRFEGEQLHDLIMWLKETNRR